MLSLLTNALTRSKPLLRSVGSAAFLFLGRALAVIFQLRFTEHDFGASYGGFIVLLNQITFYILLAELGLAAATTSLLFEPVHGSDGVRVKALIQALQHSVRRVMYWLAPASCIGVVGLSLWLRSQIPFSVIVASLLLTCCSAFATFLALPYQSHFNASDRVPTRNVLLGSGFVLKVFLGVLLARMMGSFIGLPLGTALIAILELLVQRRLVLPRLIRNEISSQALMDAQQAIRGRAKFVLFHRIGYLFSYQSDYIILLLSSSLMLLGYYAQYQYLYAGLLSFSLSAGATLTARTARRQIVEGQGRFPHLYRLTSWYTTAVATALSLCFFLLAKPAIRILYHTTAVSEKVVILFAVLLLLNVIKINDDIWIDTTGAYRTGYYLPILEACTYVAGGVLLVPRYQMAGVLYAGIVTNLIFSVGLKSFVIGRGVMLHQVRSTMVTKVTALASAAASFCLVLGLDRLMRGALTSY